MIATSQRGQRVRDLTIGGLLVILTVTAFAPLAGNDFINCDDPDYVTNNPHVQAGFAPREIAWAFTTTHTGTWHPLTWLSHMLAYRVFGADPGGHHWTNLGLHVSSTLLLFVLLRRATNAPWRSAFVAALFGVHPLHVESVAWVAERKDVLSTPFWLLATWAYVAWTRRGGRWRYLSLLLLLALGLMAKPMLVTLPATLLLLDYWPLQRWDPLRNGWRTSLRRLFVEKSPLLLIVGGSIGLTLFAQHSAGAVVGQILPLGTRAANALVSYVRYSGKLLWPVDLGVFYPHPALIGGREWPEWQVLACATLLVALTGLSVLAASRGARYVLVGWLWFIGTLVPVIGLVQVGSQAMADRYTYVPMIGLGVIAAWGGADLLRSSRHGQLVAGIVMLAVVSACSLLTWRQVQRWRDSATLFEHTLNVAGDSWFAHFNLGAALDKQGQVDRAARHYEKAIALNALRQEPFVNLGDLLLRQGRPEQALPYLRQALVASPSDALANLNMGAALASQGQFEQAIPYYEKVLAADPDHATAHFNLAGALLRLGEPERALAHYEQAVRLDPRDLEAIFNLGLLHEQLGRPVEARTYYERILQLEPDHRAAGAGLVRLRSTALDPGPPASGP